MRVKNLSELPTSDLHVHLMFPCIGFWKTVGLKKWNNCDVIMK